MIVERQISLVRAIGTEFINRKVKSLFLLIAVVGTAVLGIVIWLTTVNVWWWLLAAPVMVLVVAGLLVYIITKFVLRVLQPVLTDAQKRDVTLFVDKLERVTENIQTPMPFILLRVIKDTVWPGKEPFIQTVAHDSTTLSQDFIDLQKSF